MPQAEAGGSDPDGGARAASHVEARPTAVAAAAVAAALEAPATSAVPAESFGREQLGHVAAITRRPLVA